MESTPTRYECPKCGCHACEQDQFQATGGNWARLFDVQNKKFFTVSCARCGYTEIYKSAAASPALNVLDFFIGG